MSVFIDLTGVKFNHLTVIKRAEDRIEPSGKKKIMWLCKCDCGKEIIVAGPNLKSGNTKSCGCFHKEAMKALQVDYSGQRFGRLTALYRTNDKIFSTGRTRAQYHCVCDCGKEIDLPTSNLMSGNTQSCGCYQKESVSLRKLFDLVGNRYGRLVVINRAEDHVTPNGTKLVFWHCICDCGNEVDVVSESLRMGISRSCGCYAKEITSKAHLKDLTGTKIGRLQIEYRTDNHIKPNGKGLVKYHCICECGTEIDVLATSLLNKRTMSCGCYAREVTSKLLSTDIQGQRFGRLIVVNKSPNRIIDSGYSFTAWECKCDCGNSTIATTNALKSGHTNSCGCLKHESAYNFQDLTGKRFCKLTVLSRADNYVTPQGKKMAQFLCRCDCGNEKIIKAGALIKGLTSSCGCIAQSRMEYIINQILDENQLSYKTQVKFEDLTGVGNKQLSYDFGIYNECDELILLIECQGLQHYQAIEWFGGDEKFEIQCLHDDLKREYAKLTNIPLIEIRYDAFSSYEEATDFFEEFIMPKVI